MTSFRVSCSSIRAGARDPGERPEVPSEGGVAGVRVPGPGVSREVVFSIIMIC